MTEPAPAQARAWRPVVAATPVLAGAALASVDPISLAVGALALPIAVVGPALARGPSLAVVVGLWGGPGLELPVSWIALALAAASGEGRARLLAIPALAGLVTSLTWGCDPGLWWAWSALGALAAAGVGAVDWGLASVYGLAACWGVARALRAWQVVTVLDAAEMPAAAERFGAAWLAGPVEQALIRAAEIPPGQPRRERARRIAELGGGRLAFRALGLEPLPGWERAALLHQCGRVAPATILGFAEPPRDGAVGPGVVFSRDDWGDAETVVVPVVLRSRARELVVEAEGSFFLGWPRLEIQVAGRRLDPIEVPEEGGVWAIPVSLAAGVHRMTVAFPNPYGDRGARRTLPHVEISLR